MKFKLNDFRDFKYIVSGINLQKVNIFMLMFPTFLFAHYCKENNLMINLIKMRIFATISLAFYITSFFYFCYVASSSQEYLFATETNVYFFPSLLALIGVVMNLISYFHMTYIQTHVMAKNKHKYSAIF